MGEPIAKLPITKQANSVIVEWVGLPGAGKTTVSQAVYSKFKAQDFIIVLREDILKQWHRKNYVQQIIQLRPDNLNHWAVLRSSIVFAGRVKPINLQSFFRAWRIFSNIKRIDIAARTRDNSILLLDQGWIQEVWSVCISGVPPRSDHLKQAMAPLFHNRKTLIIHCKTDIETAFHRIQNRETTESRFDLMETDKAYTQLKKYHHYLQEIIDCARTFDISVLELDSSRSIEEQSETAANWIAQHQST
ncbi:MAG: AAA family ATPase [Limnothrix sp.]